MKTLCLVKHFPDVNGICSKKNIIGDQVDLSISKHVRVPYLCCPVTAARVLVGTGVGRQHSGIGLVPLQNAWGSCLVRGCGCGCPACAIPRAARCVGPLLLYQSGSWSWSVVPLPVPSLQFYVSSAFLALPMQRTCFPFALRGCFNLGEHKFTQM